MSPEKRARIEKTVQKFNEEHPEIKRLRLTLECSLDPDGATDEQRAAWWETEYRKLSKTDEEMRSWFAKRLKCPATWPFIQNTFSIKVKEPL
jgi:hypothetical protein